jgi:hypothetical protein
MGPGSSAGTTQWRFWIFHKSGMTYLRIVIPLYIIGGA